MIVSEAAAVDWVRELASADAKVLDKLHQLVEMLMLENKAQNLVSASSMDNVWQRHIVDSLQLTSFTDTSADPAWLDLGTGAGFPGLAIAIVYPGMSMTLVESRSRRVAWLERAASTLGLPNVRVEGRRLELVPTETFHVISARAFAPLPTLVDLAARFSTAETLWILPKGRTAAQDLATLHGWDHTFHVEQSITDRQAGIVTGRLRGRKGSS